MKNDTSNNRTSSDFVKFQEYLKKLRSAYFNSISAFYVWEAIEELRSVNVVGKKEAYENVEILSRFRNFFTISRQALNVYFLMELAKILDDARQSLHLTKLINFANSNNKKLSAAEFKAANPDREFLQSLIKRYEGIRKEDFKKISEGLKQTEEIRKKIKKHRDQKLAHEDLKKEKVPISSSEIIEVFKLIEEILNIFSYKTDFSITSYSHVENECKRDTQNIFEYLRKFEPYKIEEIKKI